MSPRLSKPVLLVLSALTLLFCACKKNRETSGRTKTSINYGPPYIITYNGNTHVGDTLQFHSNVPPGVKAEWLFRGDGYATVATTDTAPKHVFTKPGNYHVTIVIDGDSSNLRDLNPMANITVTYPFDAVTVAKMAGVRLWNVQMDSVKYGINAADIIDTIKRYQDTFAVSVLDPNTIIVKNDTLRSSDLDKTNGVTNVYTFFQAGSFSWKVLYYYFSNDSLVYSYHPPQGGYPEHGKSPGRNYGMTTTYNSHK